MGDDGNVTLLLADESSAEYVLECDSDSLLINEPHSKLYEVTFDDDHKTSHTGWARNRKCNQVSRGTTAPEDPSTQRVKVPFGCFDGMDFSQSVIPFAFNSTDVDFDLGSVRIVPNSLDQEYVLVCDSDSEVLTELRS